ncbi:methylmalonyl-CoA decarboxylase subunit epsilon [Veillonella criceti]|uniref:Uncharacterized protein n=1 Tax=Veillonella criceti TaxID=103891 RepID=A0A380NN49_9FIRM|nr:hypothetical protein [Veillonella criceti]SUP44975.1 Uncharacterised protein [Veillonella criceti]
MSKAEKKAVNDEVVAVIASAISAMGYSVGQIASIRPSINNHNWKLDGRLRMSR